MVNRRQTEIEFRRNVLKRLIDIAKLIGKRGLSYRGKRNESAMSLNNEGDHGNYLEIVMLLAKYDPVLKDHIDKIKMENKSITKGRGNKLTMLSKQFTQYIFGAISKLLKKKIADDLLKAKVYSIQIDTTQDITVKDQTGLIVRYVTEGGVEERLISMVPIENTTGASFFDHVKDILESNGIDIKNCIGSSTDGASNMQGQYNGLAAHLKMDDPSHVHVWCYAHKLNLLIMDITKTDSCLAGANLFSLLNQMAVFFRESYKRMDLWDKYNTNKRIRRLTSIGDTRWWSKDIVRYKKFLITTKNVCFLI